MRFLLTISIMLLSICVTAQIMNNNILLNAGCTQRPPVFVQVKHTDYAASATYSFTIDATPIEGNLMFLAIGGVQNRTASITGGGWELNSFVTPGGTQYYAYKFAGPAESTSIEVTFTGGTLQGALHYLEFENVDMDAPILAVDDEAQHFTAATSKNWGAYNVDNASVYIQTIVFDGTKNNSVNNGFSTPSTGSRHNAAYRVYSDAVTGENTTWSFDSATGSVGMVAFRGQQVDCTTASQITMGSFTTLWGSTTVTFNN